MSADGWELDHVYPDVRTDPMWRYRSNGKRGSADIATAVRLDNRGRPRNTMMHVQIDPQLRAEFRRWCRANGRSQSDAVTELIKGLLADE